MIIVGMSTLVAARRARVWSALVDSEQVQRWRPGLLETPAAVHDYPRPGCTVSWRANVHGLPLVLRETPLAIVDGQCLHTRLALGLFRFEAVFTASAEPDAREYTRLALKVVTGNQMPVLGGALDRFAVREFAMQLVATHLQALRAWCEGAPANAAARSALPRLPRAGDAAARRTSCVAS